MLQFFFFFQKGKIILGLITRKVGIFSGMKVGWKFTGLENSTLNSSIGVAECHSTEMAHYLG